LLLESLHEAFLEMGDRMEEAAERSQPKAAWKAVVNRYLSPEHCDHIERGCPLAALAPELARVDQAMRGAVVRELVEYKSRMVALMPGRRTADKERALFAIFSTMIGAVAIARILPDRAARAKVLATARDFLLRSF
jgi:TetR/AcrR family transcriptional repressor of nem operon